jgi:hypothetical protein
VPNANTANTVTAVAAVAAQPEIRNTVIASRLFARKHHP